MAGAVMDVDVRPDAHRPVVRRRTAGHWAQVPTPRARPAGLPRWAVELAALFVAGAGPVARSFLVQPEPRPWPTAAVALVASVALGLAGRSRVLRAALALAAGAAAASVVGEVMALWLVAGLGLADWGVRARRPLPFLPDPAERAILPLVVVAGFTAWRGVEAPGAFTPIVTFAVLGLVLLLVASFLGDQMTRVVHAVGHGAGTAVSRVLFWVLGLVVVVVPWCVQRLLRIDPLESPRRPGTAWVRRSRHDVRPTHPWADTGLVDPLPTWTRVRRAGALPLLAAVVAGVVLVQRDDPLPVGGGAFTLDQGAGGGQAGGSATGATAPPRAQDPQSPPTTKVPGAFVGEDWYPQYYRDITWLWQDKVAWDPMSMWRIKDVETETVNVRNRERVSWSPPDCGGCPRLEVWLYGGSTTFGLGQRDEHTIPSALARVAYEQGIVLDVRNKGVPGDMHWEEAQRYAWDLAEGGRPDLVLFYDGVNELWGTQRLSNLREGDRPRPVDPVKEEFWDGWVRTYAPPPQGAPDGARLAPTTTAAELDAEATGQLAVARYDRSRRTSADLSAANELPTVWFWQPSRYSRPRVRGEYRGGGGEAWARQFYASASAAVPDDVVNLDDVYDGDTRPYFYDDVHTNEKGARVVAEAMFERLRPQLELLVEAERAERGGRSGRPTDPPAEGRP